MRGAFPNPCRIAGANTDPSFSLINPGVIAKPILDQFRLLRINRKIPGFLGRVAEGRTTKGLEQRSVVKRSWRGTLTAKAQRARKERTTSLFVFSDKVSDQRALMSVCSSRPTQHRSNGRGRTDLEGFKDLKSIPLIEGSIPGVRRFQKGWCVVAIAAA